MSNVFINYTTLSDYMGVNAITTNTDDLCHILDFVIPNSYSKPSNVFAGKIEIDAPKEEICRFLSNSLFKLCIWVDAENIAQTFYDTIANISADRYLILVDYYSSSTYSTKLFGAFFCFSDADDALRIKLTT